MRPAFEVLLFVVHLLRYLLQVAAAERRVPKA